MDLDFDDGGEGEYGLRRTPGRLEVKPTATYSFRDGKSEQPGACALPPKSRMSGEEMAARLDASDGDPEALEAIAKEFFGELFEDEPDQPGLSVETPPNAGTSGKEEPVEEIGSTWSSERRFSYAGLKASHRLNRARGLFRELARAVTLLDWKLDPVLGVKNFPFLNKSINNSSLKTDKRLKEEKGEAELFHRAVSYDTQAVDPPELLRLPAWNKLPKVETRPGWLRELMTGLWFISIARDDGEITPEAWAQDRVSSDSCCLAFSIPAQLSQRFLTGSSGLIGAYLNRYLARRLATTLGRVDMAAVWVRSGVPSTPVTVFLFLRAYNASLGDDLFAVEREGRFHRTLVRHGIPIFEQGPLLLLADMADLHTKLDEDRRRRVEGEVVDDLSDIDLDSYSYQTGFDLPDSVSMVGSYSHRRWQRFAERHELPGWMSASTLMLLKDVLIHAPDLVKERKHLVERSAKRRFRSTNWKAADQVRLDVLAKLHETLSGVRVYRGSPAQLAAMIYGSGDVIGEYCQSEHKAGAARELYDVIRAIAGATPPA